MLSRRDLVHAGCTIGIAALMASPIDKAEAMFRRGGTGSSPPSSVTGKSVMNVGGVNLQPNFITKNLMKQAQFGYQNDVLPTLNANGYPTSNSFSGTYGCIIYMPSGYTGRYKINWTGAGARMALLAINTRIYSGGSFVLASTGNTILSGTNALVEFDYSVAVSAASSGAGGVVRLTVTDSGMAGTSQVYLRNGEGGLPTAWYPFTVVDGTHIDLTGTTFTGNTTGGWAVYCPYNVSLQFNNQDAISGYGGLIWVRSSSPYAGDLAAVQSGVLADQFNDDYLNYISTINSSILRWMDNSAINGTNVSRDTFNTPLDHITHNSAFLVPNNLVGGGSGAISGTTTLTATAYPSMPGTWTNGEMFQGVMSSTVTSIAINGATSGTGGVIRLQTSTAHGLTNGQRVLFGGYNGAINPGANGSGIWTITVIDSTHIELTLGAAGVASVFTDVYSSGGKIFNATIAVGGRTAKLLIPFGSQTGLGSGTPYTLNAADQATFVYDALQDAVMCVNSLLLPSIPLQYRVAFCNKVNKHYLHNFKHLYDNTSVANETAYIRDNLVNDFYPEASNELWNQGFQQSQYNMIRQINWGMQPFDNGLAGASANGLMHRVMMEQARTTWGVRSGFKPLLSTIAVGASNNDVKKFLYEGFNLNGTLYPRYAAAGWPNYNAAPNWPIGANWTIDISYAPYYNDFVLQTGGVDTIVVNSLDVSFLTSAADSYALGTGPGIAAAYSYFDNGARQGTVRNVSITSISGGNTVNSAANNWAQLFNFGFQPIIAFRNVGGALPTGITAGTAYYAINVTSTSFQVATVAAPSTPISISGGSGTTYVGVLGSATMLYWKTFLYPGHVAAAVQYSKGLINYENGYQSSTITKGQCTTLGISTSYGGSPDNLLASGGTVYNAMQGWKNAASFKTIVLEQLNDQVAAAAVGPVAMKPGWYTVAQTGGIVANDPWSIFKTDIYGFPAVQAGQPPYYSSFDAFVQFNT